MSVRIDRTLKLVLDCKREDDGAAYHVFASAIPRAAVKTYWQVINNAMGKLHTSALGAASAPKFAAEAVRSAASELGMATAADVEKNFIGEIKRLAMVILPKAGGWEPVSYEEAAKGLISEDESDEILNLLAFFTLALAFYPVQQREPMLTGAFVVHWNGLITSQDFTAWKDSLPTSTLAASSGETMTGVSSPMEHGGVRTHMGPSVPA